MEKTRKLLNELLYRVDKSNLGRPITDEEVRQVRKEIKLYENSLILYFICFLLSIITIFIVIFN